MRMRRLAFVSPPPRKYKRRSETGRHVTVRCRRALLRQIDKWRREQADSPSRPEAIRRLVALAIRGGKEKEGLRVSDFPFRGNGKMRGNGRTG